MSLGSHREDLLKSLHQAVHIAQAEADAYDGVEDKARMHQTTHSHAQSLTRIIMESKNRDDFKDRLHALIQRTLDGPAFGGADPYHYFEFQAFIRSFYDHYCTMLGEAIPPALAEDDDARALFENEQVALAQALMDANYFTTACARGLGDSMAFAYHRNPLGMGSGDGARPATFGHVGQIGFLKEQQITLQGDEVFELTPEQGEEIQERVMAIVRDVVNDYIPEGTSPNVEGAEIFYLIGHAHHAAMDILLGKNINPEELDEYYLSEKIIDLARQLLDPIFKEYSPALFHDFDSFAAAAHTLEERIAKTKQLGHVPFDVPSEEIEKVASPRRPLMDVKHLADPNLVKAVRWAEKKLEGVYRRRTEEMNAREAAGSTEENDPEFIPPAQLVKRSEHVLATLGNLRDDLCTVFTREQQTNLLIEYQQGLFEGVLYDGLDPACYSDLRSAIDIMQERLCGGIYKTDTHPWVDCFAKLSEVGEINDQAYDDVCTMFEAQQRAQGICPTLADGITPNKEWFASPYDKALHDWSDGACEDATELDPDEHEAVEELTRSMVEDLFQPYSKGLPVKTPANLAWFVARATEHYAPLAMTATQRVLAKSPPPIPREFRVINGEARPLTSGYRATLVRERRESLRVIHETDPSLLPESVHSSPQSIVDPTEPHAAYTHEVVREQVNTLLAEILAHRDCIDAATNIDHFLLAKTRLEARMHDTHRPPPGSDKPAIDQSR